MPTMLETASSTLRVISVSICDGRHAGVAHETKTFGKRDVRLVLDAEQLGRQISPPTISAMNIMITGTGFRIDQVTKFMARC